MPLNCRENTALDFEGEIEYLKSLERPKMNNKLFVYGILKRGYELDLANYGATFLGEGFIKGATLYRIGRAEYQQNGRHAWTGVGLRLNTYPNDRAYGEVWEIPDNLWNWLDEIEQNGFCYTRQVVPVKVTLDSDLYGKCMYCNQEGYTNDDEYGDGCNCPEGPCCGHCKEGLMAWTYEHTYPGFIYENPIEGGVF